MQTSNPTSKSRKTTPLKSSAQRESKKLKALSNLVKHSLPENTPPNIYPKVTTYCLNLIYSRLFTTQFRKIDNYTNYIQQKLLTHDKTNPFLTPHEVETRYERVNTLILKLSKVKVIKKKKEFIKLFGLLSYTDLSDYSLILRHMKEKNIVGLQKYEDFVSKDENYRNEKLLMLIERKKKLQAEQFHLKLESKMEEERKSFFRVGDKKDAVIVDFQDKQELYFQVLKTLRYGESEYIKKNPQSGEFQLVMNIQLQRQSVKLALEICEMSNVLGFFRAYLEQFNEGSMQEEHPFTSNGPVDQYQLRRLFSSKKDRHSSKTLSLFVQTVENFYNQFMRLIDELLNESTFDLTPSQGKVHVSKLSTPSKTIQNGHQFTTPSTRVSSNPFTPNEEHLKVDKKSTYSMLKLHALVQREMPKLIQLSNIVQACNQLDNCQILTPLSAFSNTGLVDLRLVSRYFIEQVQPPLFEYLLNFLNFGELDDKFEEFFIWNIRDMGFKVMQRGGIKAILEENNLFEPKNSSKFQIKNSYYLNQKDVSNEPGKDLIGQGKGWDSNILLEKARVPKYIGQELAQIMMDIGTMIRFFKSMELDKFQFKQKKATSKPDGKKKRRTKEDRRKEKLEGAMELETIPEEKDLRQIDIEKLTFDQINPLKHLCNEPIKQRLSLHYQKYSSQIVKAYIQKAQLSEIFEFIHRAFLFKNGDFADEIIHKMDDLLSKPAEEVYFHEVMPLFKQVTMDSSMGKSNKFTPFMEYFGVDLLLKTEGDCGWDIFCMNYRFPELLKPVMDGEMELMLQRLNLFLIKLRRIYYKMNELWLKMKQVIKSNDILKTSYNLVLRCNHMRTQMAQFITNLNSYIFYEVIASEYQIFTSKIDECESLPHLRSIVFTFLSNLLCKCYIQAPPVELTSSGPSNNQKNMFYPSKASTLYPNITKLLKTLDQFVVTYEKIHDCLYDASGSVNRYFNHKACKSLIYRAWYTWDRQYFEFLHSLGALNNLEDLIDTLTSNGQGLGIFRDGHKHGKKEFSLKNEEIGGGLGNGLAGEGRFKFDFNDYFYDSYNKRINDEFFRRVNDENKRKKVVQGMVQEDMSLENNGHVRNNAWNRNGRRHTFEDL